MQIELLDGKNVSFIKVFIGKEPDLFLRVQKELDIGCFWCG
jgi:hypothetical protein